MDPHHNSGQWRRLRSTPGPGYRIFSLRYDEMENPRNGHSETMIILESPDSVNVVAVTTAGEVLFVRQYRFGTSSYTLELPGGVVDPGEEHGAAARRELEEETGYSGDSWHYLGLVASNPVFMNNYIHHWYAEGVSLGAQQKLDPSEAVEVVAMPVDEVYRRWLAGEFEHPHTVNALLRYFAMVKLS
jgi:8-oxo-dGTP pyrophosphatase MutT (NUDIX family)